MDYEEFKRQIFKMTSIDLNAYKENQMKRRIDALIKKNEYESYVEYIEALRDDYQALEQFKLYLTINVTEFFRNPSQWQILQKEIVPSILKRKERIRVWSAACSTGDEPYSIAMILAEIMPLSRVEIIATDIDKEVLLRARAGIYTERNLINLPKIFQQKYMKLSGKNFLIDEEIKKCITFKRHNLLKDPYPREVDLIVCRNVLIYFTEEAKNEVYHRFNQALAEDGMLFVGSTEQIIMCHEFGLEPCKTFFYKKYKKVEK